MTPPDLPGHALHTSDERWHAVFTQAALGIAIADLDGHLLEANGPFCEIVGYTEDELRGRTFVEITHPEDVDETTAQVKKLRAGEIDRYVLEKRYVRKEGSSIWSHTTVTLLRNEAGEASQFLGVIRDIS